MIFAQKGRGPRQDRIGLSPLSASPVRSRDAASLVADHCRTQSAPHRLPGEHRPSGRASTVPLCELSGKTGATECTLEMAIPHAREGV
jgi:hypothetical protein